MSEVNQVEYVGDVLKSLRKKKGFTQEETAEWLGFALHTYSDWERGIRLPSPKRLKHIANKYELSQADEDALYRAAAQELPKIRKLPFPRNPLFTGREAQLGQLKQSLQANGSVALTQRVSISGLGGIGKTQLALEYAYHHYPDVYRTVLWVSAADREALEGSYIKLAEFLELPDLNVREPERSVQAVKDWLARHTNWLLIMDNADDLQLARSFFPDTHQGHILLTTRSQIVGDVAATQIEIDKMEPEEGLRFLLLRSRKLEVDAALDAVTADIREAALQVVELLDGHPLAIDQAGAYIQEAHVSFVDYITLYQKTRHELLDTRWLLDDEHREHPEYSQHPKTVAVTFDLCFKQARARHPLAGDILDFCAFLYPDAIPEELFQHDDSFKYGTTAFNKGTATLLRYSLIKRNDQEKTLSMHRLVQAVLIDDMSSDLQKHWRVRLVQALNAGFSKKNYSWLRYKRLLPHALICATWADDELTPTVGAARLFHKAGVDLFVRFRLSEAEPLLTRALPIYEQHLGAEHPETVSVLHYLARIYLRDANDDQAELLYRRILSVLEKHPGAEYPNIAGSARSLSGLSVRLHNQGQHERAAAMYQRFLIIYEQQQRAAHPRAQEIKKDYTKFLRSIGRNAEAAALEMNDEPPV